MRPGLILILIAGLAVAGPVIGGGLANQIRITIVGQDDVPPDTGKKPAAKGEAAATAKAEHLEITLQNASPAVYEGLTVRYYIFAESAGDKEKTISLAAKGQQLVNLPAGGHLTITSEVAEVTFTPTHEAAGGKGGAKGAAKAGKSTGEKFIGYGAQAEKDGKIIGQFFDPIEMTNHLDAALIGDKKAKKKKP